MRQELPSAGCCALGCLRAADTCPALVPAYAACRSTPTPASLRCAGCCVVQWRCAWACVQTCRQDCQYSTGKRPRSWSRSAYSWPGPNVGHRCCTLVHQRRRRPPSFPGRSARRLSGSPAAACPGQPVSASAWRPTACARSSTHRVRGPAPFLEGKGPATSEKATTRACATQLRRSVRDVRHLGGPMLPSRLATNSTHPLARAL